MFIHYSFIIGNVALHSGWSVRSPVDKFHVLHADLLWLQWRIERSTSHSQFIVINWSEVHKVNTVSVFLLLERCCSFQEIYWFFRPCPTTFLMCNDIPNTQLCTYIHEWKTASRRCRVAVYTIHVTLLRRRGTASGFVCPSGGQIATHLCGWRTITMHRHFSHTNPVISAPQQLDGP